MKSSLLVLTIFSITLLACQDNSSTTKKIAELERKIDSLRAEPTKTDSVKLPSLPALESWRYALLSGQVSDLQTQISQLQSDLWLVQIAQDRYKTAVFDATESTGYQVLQTSAGQFLVALDEAIPYLDGYRLKFQFGNPYSATFQGLDVTLKWGKSFERFSRSGSVAQYNKWQKSLREKLSTLTRNLEPATWNVVDIVVSPCKPDELSYIELSMTTKTVSLYKK